jgi:hypothetical protein
LSTVVVLFPSEESVTVDDVLTNAYARRAERRRLRRDADAAAAANDVDADADADVADNAAASADVDLDSADADATVERGAVDADAVDMNGADEDEDEVPITVIVLDGTWSFAKKMNARLPEAIPRMRLSSASRVATGAVRSLGGTGDQVSQRSAHVSYVVTDVYSLFFYFTCL